LFLVSIAFIIAPIVSIIKIGRTIKVSFMEEFPTKNFQIAVSLAGFFASAGNLPAASYVESLALTTAP
jgi:hypothetical protein